MLPCLTLAFETIDKARHRNSLAEYVTHLPRMINLSGLGGGGRYDEIVRGQIDAVKRAVPLFLGSAGIRGKVNARTYVRERPARPKTPIKI